MDQLGQSFPNFVLATFIYYLLFSISDNYLSTTLSDSTIDSYDCDGSTNFCNLEYNIHFESVRAIHRLSSQSFSPLPWISINLNFCRCRKRTMLNLRSEFFFIFFHSDNQVTGLYSTLFYFHQNFWAILYIPSGVAISPLSLLSPTQFFLIRLQIHISLKPTKVNKTFSWKFINNYWIITTFFGFIQVLSTTFFPDWKWFEIVFQICRCIFIWFSEKIFSISYFLFAWRYWPLS